MGQVQWKLEGNGRVRKSYMSQFRSATSEPYYVCTRRRNATQPLYRGHKVHSEEANGFRIQKAEFKLWALTTILYFA